MVPSMLLQPLVENAVRHGIDPLPAGGTIRIRARVEDQVLMVAVEDDGAGLEGNGLEIRNGVGLGALRERLVPMYPAATLVIEGRGVRRMRGARADPGVNAMPSGQMTCVVIDDEEMARRKLRGLLADAPWLTCIGEAADGPSAVRLIDQARPDVAFLDIRMPGLNGLQVIEHVRQAPRVIFTTAFEEFAVAAFEVSALDYLLKPFSASRVRIALDRLREVATPPSLLDRARAALGHDVPRQVFVRTGGTLLALPLDAIERIDGSDDYSSVWPMRSSYLLYRRLAEFAELLAPAGFLRVHRSHIVNSTHIASARSADGGRLELSLRSGAVVPVSRSYAATVREMLRGNRPG